MGMVYAPSPEQIREAAAAIRDRWDAKTRKKRTTAGKVKEWELPVVSASCLPGKVSSWIHSVNKSGEVDDERNPKKAR